MTQAIRVEFDRENFRRLLLLALLGEEVYERVGEARGTYEEGGGAVTGELLRLAHEAGMRESSPHEDHFDPAPHFDDELREIMDDYDDDAFWDELEERLGRRDFERESSGAEKKGDDKEMEAFREYYADEFETFGIDRLEINKDAPVSDIRGALRD